MEMVELNSKKLVHVHNHMECSCISLFKLNLLGCYVNAMGLEQHF